MLCHIHSRLIRRDDITSCLFNDAFKSFRYHHDEDSQSSLLTR